MANELRFVGGDLLFNGGSLAMGGDCCCGGEALPCLSWNNSGVRASISLNVEIDNLTIGTGGGCALCGTISTSRILSYTTCAGFSSVWCHSHAIGCSCSGDCCDIITVEVFCNSGSGILSISGRMLASQCATSATSEWEIVWAGTVLASAWTEGSEISLPFSVRLASGGICNPTAYLTSVMRLSYSL